MAIDGGGERLDIERPQQKRGGQFLEAVDEDEQGGGGDGRARQRPVHLPHHLRGAGAQRAGGIVDAGRDARQPAFDAGDRDGEEAHEIGQDERRARADQQQAGIDAEPAPGRVGDEIVEGGEGHQQAERQHRSRHRITEARHARQGR